MFLTTPVPHAQAAAIIRDKPVTTRAVFDALAPELQARAFLITGVESIDCIARVRELTARLPEGGDFQDLKHSILKEISPWLVTATEPEEHAKQQAAASRRAELLLRHHGQQSYARTAFALAEAHRDTFPYRQYMTDGRPNVRPAHAALNNKILPADHPFWATHTPPWEFNCHCECVPMLAEEVDEIRHSEQHLPPEDRSVMPPAQLREIEENSRILRPGAQGFIDLRTPRQRTGTGYEWRPKEDALSIDQILERFSTAERDAFADLAKNQTLDDGRSLFDWWKHGAAGAPAHSPANPGQPLAHSPANPSPTPGHAKANPVSAALSHAPNSPPKNKALLASMLSVIDHVHGDGSLKSMPVRWAAGSSGHYAEGREIKVGISGLSLSQIVHEIGHKIDREGIPSTANPFASMDASSELGDVMRAIHASSAVLALHNDATYHQDASYRRYQLKPTELWARAYAQFIAEESRHPGLLDEIHARRAGTTGYWPDSQWETADFSQIRLAIKSAFIRLGWQMK